MASIQERLKLKRAPTDVWSIREQLCLASSVVKSGDQNWISVSRSLKPIADKDSIRSSDWFSQKSCAQQYAYLLENTDIPKRKKRESGETTNESIVRRLTQDRISELTKTLAMQREEYQQLKNEISLLKKGTISDEKLQKMWHAIEEEERENQQKNKPHTSWVTKEKESKETQLLQLVNVPIQKKVNDNLMEAQEAADVDNEEENKGNKKSSLLTSLLKSTSPTTQLQTSNQITGSPTIASLLCSSPKVPGPVIIQNVSSQLHQLVSNNISNTVQERPSVSAPTLSMLLEQPSAGTQRVLQQQFQNATNLINSKNIRSSVPVQNTMQTRATRSVQGDNIQVSDVQVISNKEFSNAEISQIIDNPIDEVMPKVVPIDKDEINEIIGDIEELIKEEITNSPQTLERPLRTVEVVNNLNVQIPPVTPKVSKIDIHEPTSLSNSPTSEISIEEIDSSTTNIAKIIGTAIEIESKVDTSDSSKEKEEVQVSKFPIDSSSEKSESCNFQAISVEISKDTKTESNIELENKTEESNVSIDKQYSLNQKTNKKEIEKEKKIDEKMPNVEKTNEFEFIASESNIEEKEKIENTSASISKAAIISSEETSNKSLEQEKNSDIEDIELPQNENTFREVQTEEKSKSVETAKNKSDSDVFPQSEIKSSANNIKNNDQINKEANDIKQCETIKQDSNNIDEENQQNFKFVKESPSNEISEDSKDFETVTNTINKLDEIDCKVTDNKILDENSINDSNIEPIIKEKLEESIKSEIINESENSKDSEIKSELKIELKKENNETSENDCKQVKDEIKTSVEVDTVKKETTESVGSIEELDEEESTLSKLSGGRVMKTYSKKQNTTIDSEPENETGGETADYRAWKKSIMLVYNRLATHKYASVFLRPITEDQAPGYHSIIFRPMDLGTIKKNIDNGTIRSTTHFQRDVMLMFQNAIMFNKHNTVIYKMTSDMQEECLQHMQVLVRAAGEASFRRETRTAASISNESTDNCLKRKWTHITPNLHEIENLRMKKRRKSEND